MEVLKGILTDIKKGQMCEYLSKSALDMDELFAVLGLIEHQNKFLAQLSGGQQQRCAIIGRCQ